MQRLAGGASLALLTVAALVAGCGSGGGGGRDGAAATEPLDPAPASTTTTTAAPLTSVAERARFLAAAEELCEQAGAEMEFAYELHEGDDASFARDVYVPRAQQLFDDLAALVPPPGEEDAAAELLDEARAVIAQLAADPNRAGDEAWMDANMAPLNARVTAFGLGACTVG